MLSLRNMSKNPEVTKKRMFYEAMEGILPQLRVIIDGNRFHDNNAS